MAGSSASSEFIERHIRVIRGHKIILDADLAALYAVTTFRFNEAVKRNVERFPADFRFQLTAAEAADLKSGKASSDIPGKQQDKHRSSQIAMTSSRFRAAAYLPWAFTEHGALMAANVLRSQRAAEMSVFVIRAFVKMREEMAANAVVLKRLAEIDQTLLVHDSALRDLYQKTPPFADLTAGFAKTENWVSSGQSVTCFHRKLPPSPNYGGHAWRTSGFQLSVVCVFNFLLPDN